LKTRATPERLGDGVGPQMTLYQVSSTFAFAFAVDPRLLFPAAEWSIFDVGTP